MWLKTETFFWRLTIINRNTINKNKATKIFKKNNNKVDCQKFQIYVGTQNY